MSVPIEVLGWTGMSLIVGAYGLLSAGRILAPSKKYQFMNIAGAAALIIYSYAKDAYPSAVLNVIWVGIGVYALVRVR